MPTSINYFFSKLNIPAIALIAVCSLCLPSIAQATTWQELSPQEQQILAPLANEWNALPKKRQNNYIGIAKRYPQLTPLKQQRFQEQIVRWAKLTPAQRQQAREKRKSINQLPPEKREAEIQALREKHAKKHPNPSSAVQPVTPANL